MLMTPKSCARLAHRAHRHILLVFHRRTDCPDQPRILIERWARFVTGRGAEVIPLKAGAAG